MNRDVRGLPAMTDEEAKLAKQLDERRKATEAEVQAMSGAYSALHRLDYDAQRRAMRWLESRLFGEVPF